MQRCVPSLSAMLFNTADLTTTTELSVPLLCGSTPSSTSSQYQPPTTHLPEEHDKLCMERISAVSYLTMAAHPDGSDRVFLSTRGGKIWLASMPAQGSGGALQVDRLFLDLTDRVHYNAVLGLVGVVFHPEFVTNGRFFVSYNCDSSSSPACGAGRCWGAAARNGSRPCRYQLVVSEFSVKGGADYSKETQADPSEVRRIFTMGLPHLHKSYPYQQHGGQILFQPSDSDGYLYLIIGNGDVLKNGRSYLGKVLRFNVGSTPEESRQTSGRDTPKMDKPEIFAMGISNPSGCSFDSDRPSYLYCADVDEQQYEKVYLIRKGGHYGGSSSKLSVSIVISHGRPSDGRMPSIVGGLVYRGSADPVLEGRYLYMYSSGLWTNRRNRGYVSARVANIGCSRISPVACRGSGIGIAGRVLSFGEDNSKDAFILATGGVYRVVPPSLCSVTPQLPLQWSRTRGPDWVLYFLASCLLVAFWKVWSTIFGGGAPVECNNWFNCCYRKKRQE